MKKRISIITALLCGVSLQAADSLSSWISEGKVNGNVKYYYIETEKDSGTAQSAAHANALGGQLSYQTGKWADLKAAVTFMTTNGFLLTDSVDTSIIGKDNGARGWDATKSFSVLGEAYLQYAQSGYDVWAGAKVINTPLINAKEVRMLPSSVRGGMGSVAFESGFTVTAGYLDAFKQRTSDTFSNIISHALGADMKAVTGHNYGYVIPVSVNWKGAGVDFNLHGYHAPDFMNSGYADAKYTYKMDNGLGLCASAQAIYQRSTGNANDNLDTAGSVTGGKRINANAFGAKVAAGYQESKVIVALTNVQRSSSYHDALVLPWDGTPLFTNMITSNNLFQSNYGAGLNADSAYIGGTQGAKLAYAQGFDFTGVKGLKSELSAAKFTNSRFAKDQQDINAVLAYGMDNFSLALKGIWVSNNTSAAKDGTISQLDKLTQYRVIANYKF